VVITTQINILKLDIEISSIFSYLSSHVFVSTFFNFFYSSYHRALIEYHKDVRDMERDQTLNII